MKKNILLVEYSISSVDIIKELFSHPIYQITVVEEGDAAKKILAQSHFDLMITAAMLPKFHGFNLSFYAATNYPGLKIIIISEIYKGADYKYQAITQYKADDFFEKPLEKEKFKTRVLELLGLKEDDLSQQNLPGNQDSAPISDTRKIPIMQKTKDENKKFTSEDLFGDLLEGVKETKETKETETQGKKTGEDLQKSVTQVIKTGKKEDLMLTRQMPSLTQMLKKDASATQVLPGLDALEKEIGTTRPIKTVKAGEVSTTRKLDLDIDQLFKVKAQKNEKKENPETQRFKKIEDDISRKFEDTLSGLGIKGKNTQFRETRPMKVDEAVVKKARELETPEKEDKKSELGGYDIIGLIARGGMAEIYKAKKKGVKGFEKIIALKKILAGYNKDDKYIEMFVDEAKIAAELTHPNIVQIYDLGEKDDYYFIAMEYVPGKDLRLILQKLSELHKFLPEELSLHLILEVLKALNYAHSAKNSAGKNLDIVHRDISPPNILVSFSGDVKLTDFGVSKASIKMHQTLAGALKGKLLYMSPEQARAENDTDQRSDLYSVGIIFFELLTGEKLFMDISDIAVLHKVQLGDIIKPRDIKKDIDPQLEYIILRMLHKDKTRRYQRASDIINDIHAYMVRNYDRMPTPIHLSHTIYELFKDEIEKEEIKIDLKPLPYKINRIQRIEMEPATRPMTPMTHPIPAPHTIPMTPVTTVNTGTAATAPDPSATTVIPITSMTQLLPTVPISTNEKEPLSAEKQETLVEMKEDFHPLVEIEFDDEAHTNVITPSSMTTQLLQAVPLKSAAATEGTAVKAGPEISGMAELQAIKEEEARKRKKFLFLVIALTVIIGVIIIIFIITSGKSTPTKTAEPAPRVGAVEKDAPGNRE